MNFCGFPITDETATPDGRGRYNHFERASIYWTPQTGAHEVHGAIRDKWKNLGYERACLGYPTTSETVTPDGLGGRYNNFERGAIRWYPGLGVYVASTRPLSTIALRIARLTCVDETEVEWPGNDSMSIGGVAIDSFGNTIPITQRGLGDDYEDGSVSTWDPFEYHEFRIDHNSTIWPQHFTVMLTLAEIDSGGFSDFIVALARFTADRVRDAIRPIITQIATAIGAAIGAAIGNAIGAVIGAVIGWVLGVIVDWIRSLFEDDPFDPRTTRIAFPGPYALSNDCSTGTREASMGFIGHGGEYRLDLNWINR